MDRLYKLGGPDGKTPVRASSEDMANRDYDRRVAEDHLQDVHISTVFLEWDHSYDGGPPLLFETMVFGGELEGHQERFHTWDEAVEGHKRIVEQVKETLHNDYVRLKKKKLKEKALRNSKVRR